MSPGHTVQRTVPSIMIQESVFVTLQRCVCYRLSQSFDRDPYSCMTQWWKVSVEGEPK